MLLCMSVICDIFQYEIEYVLIVLLSYRIFYALILFHNIYLYNNFIDIAIFCSNT